MARRKNSNWNGISKRIQRPCSNCWTICTPPSLICPLEILIFVVAGIFLEGGFTHFLVVRDRMLNIFLLKRELEFKSKVKIQDLKNDQQVVNPMNQHIS